MLEAGGVISQLFYWEVITAEAELIRFYRWAFANGMDPDAQEMRVVFERYVDATSRDQYVRAARSAASLAASLIVILWTLGVQPIHKTNRFIQPPSMRLAFLADIHSNLPALEAVLADLKEQAPDLVYLVGDQVNRCPVAQRSHGPAHRRWTWPAIFGNHDLVVGAT